MLGQTSYTLKPAKPLNLNNQELLTIVSSTKEQQ